MAIARVQPVRSKINVNGKMMENV